MGWIIGEKDTETVAEVNHKLPDFSLSELQELMPPKYNVALSELSFYQLTEEENENIIDGYSYIPTWVGGEITGINFAPELLKPWAKLSCNKEYIDNDNIDTAILTLEIWKPDLSEIDSTFQFPGARVPVRTPDGSKIVKFDIVNGSATANFHTTKSGTWVFPGVSKRYNSLRIFNQVMIEVDDLDILN